MSFPSELVDALNAGRVAVRSLIKFEFGEGTYGIWNGIGVLPWNGTDYVPNKLVSVEEPPAMLGTQALPIVITMTEDPNSGMTPETLLEIEDLDYKNKPVTIYDAYFDPDTQALLHVIPMWSGYVDFVDHEVKNRQAVIVGHIESRAIDNHRDGFRTASHEDQQLVSPNDLFFEHASTTRTDYYDITFD
jgi:hypothetical protein